MSSYFYSKIRPFALHPEINQTELIRSEHNLNNFCISIVRVNECKMNILNKNENFDNIDTT